MGRVAFAKTSFAAGQLSPRVSRRIDVEQYFNGASQIENFICLPFGGVEKTPGTVYTAEVRDSSKAARLFDFIFNRRSAYVLALNDSKIRFFKDRGVVNSNGTGALITGITKANPAVVTTATNHGLENGDIVILHDVDGMEEVNEVEYTVANKTATTFELSGINSTNYNTFIASTATVLLLHLNSDLSDSSSVTPHTVTAVGGAAISTAQSKFGGGSCYFDGAGDYLTILDNADFDFSGGTFTIDCWVRPTSLASIRCIFQQSTDASNRCQLFINTDGSVQFTVTAAGSTVVSVVTNISAVAVDEWHHIALVEDGDSWTIFVNGSISGTSTDTSRCANYTGNAFIGILYDGTTSPFQGYIDEFRITAGVARYSASAIDSYTKLLLHCNGMDASTTFTDSSPSAHTVTANNQAQVDTAQSKFGGASLYVDGNDDSLSVPDNADWDFGTGDFTIECWARWSAVNAVRVLMDVGRGQTSNGVFLCTYGVSGELEPYINGVKVANGAFIPVVDTWYHIALSRSGTDVKSFVNGTIIGTGTNSANITGSTEGVHVGADYNGTGDEFIGWIDEVRISKGIARYTAAFTPSTGEYGGATVPTHEGYAYNSAGGVYEIAHTYTDSELFDIQTAQASDIMYLAHPDHAPMKLSRYADDDWTLETVVFEDGPYFAENTETTTLDPSGTSGSVTVTASAITGINNDTGFQTTDVGRMIRYHDGTNYFWMVITARASTTSVTATIKWQSGVRATTTMGGHAATTKWALGSWSDTTGYPHAVVFHQSRLWFAGTDDQPQTVWGSVIEDYENHTPGADDEDAIDVTLGTNRVNIIEWLAAEKRLVIGTAEQIFTMYAGTVAAEGITPTNVKVDPETNYGCSPVYPEQIGSLLYYVGADTKKVREFSYGFDIDRYRSVDRQILADDITGTGIKEMAFQKSPYGVLYCVLNNGAIATLTREVDQQVNAWSKQTTDGTYESVTVIPTDGYDEMWFVVNRTINGSTKRYIEYQANPNQAKDANIEDQILLHSTLTYDGSPTATVTGLDHLEAEAVHALCDGVKVTGTVSGGSLALGASYSVVQVGLPYTGEIKLLPPEAGSQQGSAQGLMKRAHEILVSVYRTLGLKVGEDGGNLESMRTGAGAIPTTLQTDDFTFPGTIGWDKKNEIYLEAPDPHPCTILLMVMMMQVNEK